MTRLARTLFALLALTTLVLACSDDPSSPDGTTDSQETLASASLCVPPALDEILIGLIQGMHGEVDALHDQGALTDGQARALTRHLVNATRQHERGEDCAARDQIVAFREQFDDFAGDMAISDRDAFEVRLLWRRAVGDGQIPPPGEEEQYAPGVEGELKTVQVGGDDILVEVIDGLAIFTGDIILGFADELEAGAATIEPGAAAGGPQKTGPCTQDGLICGSWSDGVVGYDYFRDWGDFDDNQRMIDLIQLAINHWEAETGLRFERRATGERIVFRSGSGCSSWVGRNPLAIFDPQYVFLHPTMCATRGVIVHEIGHAIGLFHEQSRNDRSDHIAVHFDAIQDDAEANFFQYLVLGNDVGRYDFGSIMHYACGLFRADDATRDPIEPIVDGVTCDGIGQRGALSENDVLGAYWLYRPVYTIGGAVDGETRDRFVLTADFTTEPVADEYIVWTVNRARRSTGPSFNTLEEGLEPGTYVIGADIVIGGVTIGIEFVGITIANDAPVVSLGPDRTVDMNRTFNVFADVTDAEDGSCAPTVCTYAWDPAPTADLGGAAQYHFAAPGLQAIEVTVTDGGGASGTDGLVVTVVDSPPVPVIEVPTSGTFSAGAATAFAGFATDANFGPGPGPGELPCSVLDWSSSDPSDVVTETTGCDGTITFGDPGTRTLTLEASDGTGNTASASVQIDVEGCDLSGCAPNISFVFDTPSDLDGSQFSPTFTEPGYHLDTTIEMRAGIADADGPGTGVALEWRVQPPCSGSGACDEIVIGSGNVFTPNNAFASWTPSDDVEAWTDCVFTPLPYEIRLYATDGAGNTSLYARTIYLGCEFI